MQRDQLDPESPGQDHNDLERQDKLSKKQALRYILVQMALTLSVSALIFFYDLVTAYSVLTGGIIATVSNAWFTYKVYRVGPDQEAKAMLASVYVGEAYKIILTSALFICAFVLIKPIDAAALLITYFLVHISPLLVNVFGGNTEDIEYKRENDG